VRSVPEIGVTASLFREHGAMARQLASLQQRMGDLLRTHAHRIAVLEADNLRLRADLVLIRTSLWWGLGGARQVQPRRFGRAPTAAAEMPEAQAVICQTGCVGHAHPWRDDQGQCQRTGQACELPVLTLISGRGRSGVE
jgi:hypothetical protein